MNGYVFGKAICTLVVLIASMFYITTAGSAQTAPGATGAPTIPVPPGAPVVPGAPTVMLQDSLDMATWYSNQVRDEYLVAALVDQTDGNLGATLQPVGDALRAQLSIPKGRGILVASLKADSPSAKAGLKQNDILLTLADKPLSAPDDLTKHLKSVGETAVPLNILRAGKPVTIQVRPIYRVTIGPVEERKTEYYIGVQLDSINDALRMHLGLPADKGLIVAEVVSGTPAEKAGVKKYDIVLEMGDKAIDSRETFSREVQIVQDKPTKLKLLREGKPISVSITGAVRNVETSADQEKSLRLWSTLSTRNNVLRAMQLDPRAQSAALEQAQERLSRLEKELQALNRIETLEKELKALREAVERANESLKPGKGTKQPSGIGGGEGKKNP